MKKFLLLFLCFTGVAKSYGQLVVEITKARHQKLSAKVELKSAVAGADSAWVQTWVKSVESNLNRTIQVDKRAKKGKYIVSVKFIVSKDGSLSDIQCESDPGFGMCQEVLRVIKKSKNWNSTGTPAEVRPYRVSTSTQNR